MKKIFLLGFLLFSVSSCTCGTPLKVTPIQGDDKKLACKDVILEINESEHYREQAAKEKSIGFGEALLPMCWVSGYVNGEQAVKAANARIDYLGRIYDLLDCGGNEIRGGSIPPPPVAVQVAPNSPPPPAFVGGEFKPYSKPEAPSAKSHYRSVERPGSAKMHEHRDKNGKIYMHSHPHTGPHRHFEDY